MKKHFLLTVLLLSATVYFSRAQNAFYHSKFLVTVDEALLSRMENSTDTLGRDIANRPVILQLTTAETDEIKRLNAFRKDPLGFAEGVNNNKIDFALVSSALAKYNALVKSVVTRSAAHSFLPGMAGAVLAIAPALASGISNLGNVQETDFYDALAKYIAQEFKKSVTLTYMQGFKATIGKIGELKFLMPATYELLENKDPFTYPDYGKDEKESYDKDLRSLLPNFMKLVEQASPCGNCIIFNSTISKKITDNNLYPYVRVAFDLGDRLISKYHPVDVLNYLDQQYFRSSTIILNNNNFDKLGMFFHGLNVLQSNLRDSGKIQGNLTADAWVSFEEMKQLAADPQRLRYFMSLLFMEDRDFFKDALTEFKTNFDSNGNVSDMVKLIDFYRKRVLSVHQLLVKLQEFKKDQVMEDKEYTHYMQLMFDLLSVFNQRFMNGSMFSADQLFVAQKSLDILKAVHEKHYTNMVMHFDLLTKKLVSTISLSQNDQKQYDNLVQMFDKYGRFITDMVNTENSEEMKVVIEKHVAPANSYLKKRRADIAIGISGYPGFFAGAETLRGDQNPETTGKKTAFNFGLTAPVGIDLVFGLKKKVSDAHDYIGKSVSIFLQLIDLASIVNYRITDDSTSRLPEKVKFEHLFSPGISVNFGLFKNNAVNLGVGYQWTAKLRSINKDGNEYSADSNRWFIRVAWDLPLLHIYKYPK